MLSMRRYRFAIVGGGVTGKAVARFLLARGIPFFLSSRDALEDGFREWLSSNGVEFEEGKNSLDLISRADEIVVSPSVRPEMLGLDRNQVISEIDLASRFFEGRIIAVTGTNGKSSTVSALEFVLNHFGVRAVACGNIGRPFISIVDEAVDIAVVEVSSFQLFSSMEFSPDIGVVLNLTEDHMDWHMDMDEYGKAKASMLFRMDEGMALLNADSEYLSSLEGFAPAVCVRRFSKRDGLNENEACVVEVMDYLGYRREDVLSALREFKGLDYRMQFIASHNGIIFVNDSKATNPASTFWGLDLLKARGFSSIILLAGGSPKGLDFSGLLRYRDIVKVLICYGQEGGRIFEQVGSQIPSLRARGLKDAFDLAVDEASTGDVVLLSPMCASFDEFSGYKERGEFFNGLVKGFVCTIGNR